MYYTKRIILRRMGIVQVNGHLGDTDEQKGKLVIKFKIIWW